MTFRGFPLAPADLASRRSLPLVPLVSRRILRSRVAQAAGAAHTHGTTCSAARADKRRSASTLELVRSRRGPKHSRTAHARIRMKAHTRHTGRRTTEAERRDSDARLHGAPPPRQLHSQSRQHPHSGLRTRRRKGERVGQPWYGEHPANAPKCATEAAIPSSNGGAPKHSSAEGPHREERRSARPGGLDTPMIGLQGFEPTRDPYPTSAVLPTLAGRSSHGLDPLQGVPLATLRLCKDNISPLLGFLMRTSRSRHA